MLEESRDRIKPASCRDRISLSLDKNVSVFITCQAKFKSNNIFASIFMITFSKYLMENVIHFLNIMLLHFLAFSKMENANNFPGRYSLHFLQKENARKFSDALLVFTVQRKC